MSEGTRELKMEKGLKVFSALNSKGQVILTLRDDISEKEVRLALCVLFPEDIEKIFNGETVILNKQ